MTPRATRSRSTPPRPFAAMLAIVALSLALALPSIHALGVSESPENVAGKAIAWCAHGHDEATHRRADDTPADHHTSSTPNSDHDPATCPVCQIILATPAALPSLAFGAPPVWDTEPALDLARAESQVRLAIAVTGHLPARGPPHVHA